jgi:hypothetical protein
MTKYQAFLLKLQQNLNTLQEREAKYAGNAPLELLNQIAVHGDFCNDDCKFNQVMLL